MKRFSDTAKWIDPWFRRLSPAHKLAWMFVLDNCDECGIWSVDFALFKTLSGALIDEAEFMKALKGRAQLLPRHRWWVPKFITFQYGQLSPGCRRHLGVMNAITKNGLDVPWREFLLHVNDEAFPDVEDQTPDDEPDLEAAAEEIYQAYPLKVGKPKALKAIKTALKSEKPEVLLAKTKAFAGCQPANLKYCPHPSSWFNAARYNDPPATWIPSQDGGRQTEMFVPKKTLIQKDLEALARQAKTLS